MSVVNQFIINCKADKQEYLPSSDYGSRMNQWVASKSHIFQIDKSSDNGLISIMTWMLIIAPVLEQCFSCLRN